MKHVLVIGGYGAVGRHVVMHLHATADVAVTVAGRSEEKAQHLGRKFDSRVGGRSLDARDPAALDMAVSEVDVVICCTETGNLAVADACIRHGTDFVAIAASVLVLGELAARHDWAVKAGSVGIIGVGLAPGITNLLARQLASVRDDWATLSIVVHLGMGDRHGAEAVAWTLRQAAAANHSVALDLPDPTGRRSAVPIAFVDQTGLAAKLAVSEVRSYLTLDPDIAAKMLPAIGRAMEAIRRINPGAHEALCQLLAKAAVGSDRLMVSVEAGSRTGTARSWMTGRAQSRITGVVAAHAALKTLVVPIPAGVRYVDDVLSLDVLGSVLQEIGCCFHSIASASEEGRRGLWCPDSLRAF